MLAEKLLKPSSGAANYIEDVFSTYIYTGTGATQTITNNIDLSTKGGLVWIKDRSQVSTYRLTDTVRGATKSLNSDTIDGQATDTNGLTAFNTSGFTIGSDGGYNNSGSILSSWTFRKQPKFFDIVTYTGNGVAGKTISHNLGSVPGCIIVKKFNVAGQWCVYHKKLNDGTNPQNYYLFLNNTDAQASTFNIWNNTAPTSTQFTVGSDSYVNSNGATYVAYIFADNAGGFGLTGTDNVISCGSYTHASQTVNLGYEPQFILYKSITSAASDWLIFDSMRGMPVDTTGKSLFPNASAAESTQYGPSPTATGFVGDDYISSGTYIYIAIRRGPMKVPTDGTKVFSPIYANNAAGTANTTGFPVSTQAARLVADGNPNIVYDRLRGVSSIKTSYSSQPYLFTTSNAAESKNPSYAQYWTNTGFNTPAAYPSANAIYWNFQRAPGFFDEVCYTGTGSAKTVTHNLGVAPELVIVKRRDGVADWPVGMTPLGFANRFLLNDTAPSSADSTVWNSTAPTSSVFSVGTSTTTNGNNWSYVAYLFASLAGVSKVGTYTGNGSTQTINCGFTGGARFVLIKRDNNTYNWCAWDTARGMAAGSSQYLPWNTTTTAVVANDVYTTTGGFQLASSAAYCNAAGATYYYLAIA